MLFRLNQRTESPVEILHFLRKRTEERKKNFKDMIINLI